MIGKGISKFKGNHAATHLGGASDPISVGQAELRTSSGSISQTGSNGVLALPGGEYGFFVQTKHSRSDYGGAATLPSNLLQTIYGTYLYMSSQYGTIYALQRYVTASGEIHWLFILRERDILREAGTLREKEIWVIRSMWQAPDHPCFGNGGKPELLPHPFPNFNPETQEILIVTMTPEEFERIEDECYDDVDGLPNGLSPLEVIERDYDIDDSIEPPWPEIPVTVGLPRKAKLQPGERVQPIKKRVPKPAMVRTARLKPRI